MNYRKFIPLWAAINTRPHSKKAAMLASLFTAQDYSRIHRQAMALCSEMPFPVKNRRDVQKIYQSVTDCCQRLADFIYPSMKAAWKVHYITCDPMSETGERISRRHFTTVLQSDEDTAEIARRIVRGGLKLRDNICLLAADLSTTEGAQRIKSSPFYDCGKPLYINLGMMPVWCSEDTLVSVLKNLHSIMTSQDNLVFSYVMHSPCHGGSSFGIKEYSFHHMEHLLSAAGFNIYEDSCFTDSFSLCRTACVLCVKSLEP